MRPWILAECNYAHVKQQTYEVAVLPLGATEPHNLHLPYGTDSYEGDEVGSRACEWAHRRGGKVILLPTIPYGTETNQSEFPLSMNLNPSTVQLIVTDLVETLVHSGVRKIVLLNSHGGNELKPVLRELYGKIPEAYIFLTKWYELANDVYDQIFEAREDHAGELETSLILAYYPELVGRNEDGTLIADAGEVASPRLEGLRRGWASITRPWHLLTTNSGSGNPHAASAEKGERVMNIIVERLGSFLLELSEAKLDERFPF